MYSTIMEGLFSRSWLVETVSADVVRDVHRLVGAGVRAPAARKGAVLAPGPVEGRVQRAVGEGDRHGVALEVPGVRQRVGREVGVHGRRKGLLLEVVADELQGF